MTRKLNKERTKRVNFDAPLALHSQLRITAMRRGETMSGMLRRVLEAWVQKRADAELPPRRP